MSSNNNNKRKRRAIVEILFEHGPCTREEVAAHLSAIRGVRHTPSPNSISALMSKNPQTIIVGKQRVEATNGEKSFHMLFDVDREVVREIGDLIYTRPISIMTPKEKAIAVQCKGCGCTRIMPDQATECLSCERKSQG